MRPAQQRLEALDRRPGELDDRLVVEVRARRARAPGAGRARARAAACDPVAHRRVERPPPRRAPASFAWYIAVSASRSSASASTPVVPGSDIATPMLTETGSRVPRTPERHREGEAGALADLERVGDRRTPSTTMTNSSPPIAGDEVARPGRRRSRSATARSSSSPRPWPVAVVDELEPVEVEEQQRDEPVAQARGAARVSSSSVLHERRGSGGR